MKAKTLRVKKKSPLSMLQLDGIIGEINSWNLSFKATAWKLSCNFMKKKEKKKRLTVWNAGWII